LFCIKFKYFCLAGIGHANKGGDFMRFQILKRAVTGDFIILAIGKVVVAWNTNFTLFHIRNRSDFAFINLGHFVMGYGVKK